MQVVADAPLQLYFSIAFAPKMSIIRRTFENEFPDHIKMFLENVEENWTANLQTLEGHSHEVKSLAFSENGQLLASASSDCSVKLWNAGAGGVFLRQTLYIGQTIHDVNCVAFSHDSQLLASGNNNNINLWYPSTGALQQTLEGHRGTVSSLAFSCGRLLASASTDQTIKLWDIDTGTLQHTLKGHSHSVSSVAFTHGGQLLASGSFDGTIKLWNAHTGILKQTLEGHSHYIESVAFSHDDQLLASASEDSTIKLWDTETGVLQQTLTDHSDRVLSVTFSPDDRLLASASGDRTVRLWDMAGAERGTLQQILRDHCSKTMSVAFSYNGQLLACASDDHTIKLWDTDTITPQQPYHSRSDGVGCGLVVFSHDGKLLTSAYTDGTIKLWDAATGVIQQIFKVHLTQSWKLTLSYDSQFLASVSWGGFAVWNTCTGVQQWACGDGVGQLAFSHDNRLLASAGHTRTVKLWDPQTGTLQRILTGHSDAVHSVLFSYDDQLLVSATAHTVNIWDASTGRVLRTFDDTYISLVAISHDGKLLASCSMMTVKLWDISTGILQQTISLPPSFGPLVSDMEFSSSGPYLITNKGTISIQPCRANFVSNPPEAGVGAFFQDNQWVGVRGKRVVWLPREFRGHSAIHGDILAFGNSTGRVSIIDMSIPRN